jgi:hypothetical protein
MREIELIVVDPDEEEEVPPDAQRALAKIDKQIEKAIGELEDACMFVYGKEIRITKAIKILLPLLYKIPTGTKECTASGD